MYFNCRYCTFPSTHTSVRICCISMPLYIPPYLVEIETCRRAISDKLLLLLLLLLSFNFFIKYCLTTSVYNTLSQQTVTYLTKTPSVTLGTFLSFFFLALRLTPAMTSSFMSILNHNDAPKSVGLLWTCDQPDAVDLYLTTHITHNRRTSMPLAGFETTISAGEWPQTHALDRATTGTGISYIML